jgi:hypothetical protein
VVSPWHAGGVRIPPCFSRPHSFKSAGTPQESQKVGFVYNA